MSKLRGGLNNPRTPKSGPTSRALAGCFRPFHMHQYGETRAVLSIATCATCISHRNTNTDRARHRATSKSRPACSGAGCGCCGSRRTLARRAGRSSAPTRIACIPGVVCSRPTRLHEIRPDSRRAPARWPRRLPRLATGGRLRQIPGPARTSRSGRGSSSFRSAAG